MPKYTPGGTLSPLHYTKCKIAFKDIHRHDKEEGCISDFNMFHSQFLGPISSVSVGYKNESNAQWTASATNPQEEFKMRKFGARKAKFFNNDQM